jgi:hypothetical protein
MTFEITPRFNGSALPEAAALGKSDSVEVHAHESATHTRTGWHGLGAQVILVVRQLQEQGG